MQQTHDMTEHLLAVFRDHRTARRLVFACVTIFLLLALIAVNAEKFLLEVDTAVQESTIEARTGWLNTAMVMLTELGTRYVIGVLALGLAAWAWMTGRCKTTTLIIIAAFAINPVFEILFKELVGRVRPNLDQILPGNGPSFPSGHVLATVGFYGLIPLVVWEATTKRWLRIASLAGALSVIILVGFSRVYLDVHWTTDVLAGYLLGTVLVAATYHALSGHSLYRAKPCCVSGPSHN